MQQSATSRGQSARILAGGARLQATTLAALFPSGADLNLQDRTGNTALHLACRLNRAENVRFLVARGADITLLDEDRQSAAMIASDIVCLALILDGIRSGFAINGRNNKGETLLHLVARLAWQDEALELLKPLLDLGADPIAPIAPERPR